MRWEPLDEAAEFPDYAMVDNLPPAVAEGLNRDRRPGWRWSPMTAPYTTDTPAGQLAGSPPPLWVQAVDDQIAGRPVRDVPTGPPATGWLAALDQQFTEEVFTPLGVDGELGEGDLDGADADGTMLDYGDFYGAIAEEHDLGDGLRLTRFDGGDLQLNADLDGGGRAVFADLTAGDALALADALEEALDLDDADAPIAVRDVRPVATVAGTGIVVGVDHLLNVRLFLPDSDEDESGEELHLTQVDAEVWVDRLRALAAA